VLVRDGRGNLARIYPGQLDENLAQEPGLAPLGRVERGRDLIHCGQSGRDEQFPEPAPARTDGVVGRPARLDPQRRAVGLGGRLSALAALAGQLHASAPANGRAGIWMSFG
jgi:hypothetical protein